MARVSAPKPLLALVMIVKNEERSIRKTLESVEGAVDSYLLLDTGSTDRTREIVRKAVPKEKLRLCEEPFVDFATTRNRALDLERAASGCGAEFTLMLSGDEELREPEALRAFCETRRVDTAGAYYLQVRYGDHLYDSARLARSSSSWRYVGATHEVLTHPIEPPPSIRVEGAHIFHDISHRDDGAQTKKWERDAELLTAALAKDRTDARAAFYLALTLAWLGRNEEATTALRRRIGMGGWAEEVYQARMRLAGVLELLDRPWRDVEDVLLAAFKSAPHRAEPLYEIAKHYNSLSEHALTFLYASHGNRLPLPTEERLFVDESVYTWKLADLVAASGYWIGQFEEGEKAALKAARAMPEDERLARNLVHYLRRPGSLPSPLSAT